MSGGFEHFAKQILAQNRALKNGRKNSKFNHGGGSSTNGKKPLVLNKANKEKLALIAFEKELIRNKIKFRKRLLLLVLLLFFLLFVLFYSFS